MEAIRTARLLLRSFTVGDAAAVFEYASDPVVTRFMDWPTHTNLPESVAFVEANVATAAPSSERTWAITIAESGKLIGAASVNQIDDAVSFGYVLARSVWNSGYASEVAAELLSLLASCAGVTRIWATCDIDNTASVRVLEKAGLQRERVLSGWAERPNLPGKPRRDAYLYALNSRHTGAPLVRELAAGEHRRCATLYESAWNQSQPEQARRISVQEFEEETRDELMLVAVCKDEIVGYISLWVADCFIHHLYVSPGHHGQGIRRLLINHVSGRFTSQPLTLKCQLANTSALGFYTRLGFVRTPLTGTDAYGDWCELRLVGD